MCQKESWGAIAVPEEAHSTQRCQPPRMGCGGTIRLSVPADAMTMTTTTTTMMMRIFVYLFTAHIPDDIQSGLQSVMIINVYYIFPL